LQILDCLPDARQKKPIYHPIAGFLEEAWQRPVKVHEKECMALGGV
jgi:predicted hydrocarbon binding protein